MHTHTHTHTLSFQLVVNTVLRNFVPGDAAGHSCLCVWEGRIHSLRRDEEMKMGGGRQDRKLKAKLPVLSVKMLKSMNLIPVTAAMKG